MRTIWKYEVPSSELPYRHVLKVPPAACVRHVDVQCGTLCVWIEVYANTNDSLEVYHDRVLRLFGTGHDIPDRSVDRKAPTLSYHGSVVMRNNWVVHVYEELEG